MRNEFSSGIIVYKHFPEGLKFLFLIKRDGNLDMPKGHIEKGESEIVAAMRETREECNAIPAIVPFFKKQTRYFFYNSKGKVQKHLTMFLGESKDDKIRISHEHKGYVWLNMIGALKRSKYKATRAFISDAHEYVQKLEQMNKINSDYSNLPSNSRKWDLSRNFVPGEGPLNAKVVLLGQAPGQKEDAAARPFIGRSGMLLDKMLNNAKLKRSKLYITSTVQFFPPKNRVPTDEEIELCKPFLKRQLDLINPKYVVLMGLVATKTMLDINAIDPNHSKTFERYGRKYFVTFHPAAALRFQRIEILMQRDFINFKRILGR